MITIKHQINYFIYCLIILAALIVAASSVSTASVVPATLWENHYGGSQDQTGETIWQTSDNGFIIVGTGPDSSSTYDNLLLVKTDGSGNQLWSKTFGENAHGYSVRQTSDAGYIATGSDSDNLYIVKTDASGNKQWEKTYAGTGQTVGNSVQQTSDGGYIIAGQVATKVDDWDVYLIKTDGSGNKLWDKTIGTDQGDDISYSVWQTSDGGYILGGLASTGNNPKPNLIKVDANGDQQWTRTYEGTDTYDNFQGEWCGVQQTRDGGYIYAGEHSGNTYLLKTDASGNKQWDHDYGVTGANSVQQTWDDGYILAGFYTDTDGADKLNVIRTDASGNQLWQNSYTSLGYAEANSVLELGNGTFVVTGWTKSDTNGNNNIYLALIDKDMTPVPNAQVVSDSIPSQMEAGQSYTVSLTFLNNGTMPWTFQDKTAMGNTGDSIGDASKFGATVNQTVQIGTVVRPGQSYTFSETLKAPAENGTYNPQFRMVWLDHQMFGAPINKTVTVVNGTGPAAGIATALPSTQATTKPTASTVSSTPVASQTPATATAKASPISAWVPILALGMAALGIVAYRKRGDQ